MIKLNYYLFFCITLTSISCDSKNQETIDPSDVITTNVENGAPSEFTKSELDDLQLKANNGDKEAQYKLGGDYSNRSDLPEDQSKATYWFRLSAEQGLGKAQYNLALRLANGTGVEKNDSEAVSWYKKAEEQGLDDARSNLAMHILLGRGVDKDREKAEELFRISATNGYAAAQANLALILLTKKPIRTSEAVEWLVLASLQGETAAQVNLSIIYSKKNTDYYNPVRAYIWATVVINTPGPHRKISTKTLEILDKRMNSNEIEKAKLEAKLLMEAINKKNI